MNKYDAIVVGGGIAGLTATAYLARAGQKVLLIEKNREPGGLVNSFWRNGFLFDAGVRALEDAGIILPMLKDLKIDLQVVKSPVSIGIENEILNIRNIESLSEYKDLLKKLYPGSSQEVDEVVKTIRRIMKYMDVLYGIENPLFKDLKHDTSFIFKKLIPWFPRFLLTLGKINRLQMPVNDYLNCLIKNPSLRDIISQHFFRNTPTFFALSYFSLYLDYFYPRGGVGKLSEALRDKILELGGQIKTGVVVTGVSPDNNTVTDDNNISYKYKNLIWAADLKTLYQIAAAENLESGIKEKFEDVKTKILSNKGGDSVFSLFLEIDEPLESFAKIANGHFFYTPSRQGLGKTHREELDELLNNFNNTTRQKVFDWLDRFLSLNTFEISIPGLKDKELVPPGKTGMIISFLADYELFKKIEDAGWIEQFVSGVGDRILRIISESVYPVLKDKVIDRFSFSPLTIHNRTASSGGAIVGWEFQKNMPVINNIRIADRSVLTPLPSVYQAGQWAYSPAGVPMSILTGKIAADKILKLK
ncbi:MAG: NAD(P)/FAD-dependent oxidoreductase [Bacteroidales bacterium]|nr:NAD(P)/FAD-dependent oxidoreductase [Bacteroidales bacterium]MDD3989491.1 NAD(P)/FAD-dependent oxidoreductase [Bacteroidales bacterium]